MARKVIIVTAEWDQFRDQLRNLCSQLIKDGIECHIKDYGDPVALQLIIKYGIDNGIVRIPQIYLINDDGVRRINYDITDDLRLVVRELGR